MVMVETRAIAPRKMMLRASTPSSPAPPPSKPAEEPAPAPVEPTPAPQEPPAPPPATPEPAPVAPPPVVAAPAYSLDSAHVDLGGAQTVGATAAGVDRALAPVKARLDACYRTALPKASVVDGTASLHLETDDVGTIRQAIVMGSLAAETGACVSKAVVGRKVANVDTGHASADVPMVYRLR